MIMDDLDLKILATLQEGFPLVPRPFLELGNDLGISEDEVMDRVKSLMERGLVRRIGPVLDLRRLGISGVLVAILVPVEEAESVSIIVNQYKEISHNYLRPNESGYNMWFTISAKPDRISEILEEIYLKTNLPQLVLPTRKIFKIGVKFDIL